MNYMFRNKWQWVMAILLYSVASHAFAAATCSISQGAGQNIGVNIQKITASNGNPNNTVLGSQQLSVGAISFNCGTSVKSRWTSSMRAGSSISGVSNVYSTNVQGVGFRIHWPLKRSGAFWPTLYQCTGNCSEPADSILVEFVQTGPVLPGTIPVGELGKATLAADNGDSNSVTMLTVTLLSPIEIAVKSCSARAEPGNLDLGAYDTSFFEKGAQNQGALKLFKIIVTCPQSSTVSLQFNGPGSAPLGAGKGVIDNLYGSAKGVSVRIMDNVSPVKSAVDVTGATSKSLGTISGQKTYNYNAQIYAYNTANISAGDVNTYLMFTINVN